MSESVKSLFLRLLDLSLEERGILMGLSKASDRTLPGLDTVINEKRRIITALSKTGILGDGSDMAGFEGLDDIIARQRAYNILNIRLIQSNTRFVNMTLPMMIGSVPGENGDRTYGKDGRQGKRMAQSLRCIDRKA